MNRETPENRDMKGSPANPTMAFSIESFRESYRGWAKQLFESEWGGVEVVSRGRVWDASQLLGLVARIGRQLVGLVTYRIEDGECELVTLNSLFPNAGVGTALITEVREIAQKAGCQRLWLITTNDNTQALRFYQSRGFHLVAHHRNAIKASRKLKPTIPLIGINGIPILDELELEIIFR
jgi:ribosomal protein S18 acetylase RimI-like enzyme